MLVLFASVLVHEFAHCFVCRALGGFADEVVLWPLGGLASLSAPHTPSDRFMIAAAGPASNMVICLLAGLWLLVQGFLPSFNPAAPFDLKPLGEPAAVTGWTEWLGIVFAINWILFLLNLLPGLPLDGANMLRAALWPRTSFVEATIWVARLGLLVAALLGVLAVLMQQLLLLALAACVLVCSDLERRRVEAELAEDMSMFGAGYGEADESLGGTERRAGRRRQSLLQRWRAHRARIRQQREQEAMAEMEQRVDELLEKVHRHGIESLTRQERSFLKRVSERYRHRLNQ
jgi:Zn-dependent protease